MAVMPKMQEHFSAMRTNPLHFPGAGLAAANRAITSLLPLSI
jgi:hypothetical protein